jgi:hypothetical protein
MRLLVQRRPSASGGPVPVLILCIEYEATKRGRVSCRVPDSGAEREETAGRGGRRTS